jgi:hypothetical protein
MILWISLGLVVLSPFLSLSLLIWVFSLLYFVMLSKSLSILLIFSKNQLFVSLILCINFFVSMFSILTLILIFLSVCCFRVWFVLVFEELNVHHLVVYFRGLCFFNVALLAISFPCSMAFAVFHRFWEVFFHFHRILGSFNFFPFFGHPLILQQCVV